MFYTRNPQRHKFHYSFLIPSIILSLLCGFLGSLVINYGYPQIRSIEHEDVFFLGFKLSILIGFLGGFFLKRILEIPFSSYLEISIIFFQILQIFIVTHYSSWNLQVDYIFFTQYFQFFTFLNSFSLGYLISGMHGIRLWLFLLGVVSYFTYSYFIPIIDLNIVSYCVLFIFVSTLEFTLHSAFPWLHKSAFKKFRLSPKPINDVLFYSSLTLFVAHTVIFYMINKGELAPFAMGSSLGFFIFNLLFHTVNLRKNLKRAYLIGRIGLLVNLAITSNQLYLSNYFALLFFLDLAGIAFFRPNKLRKGYTGLAIVSGFVIAYISFNLQTKYAKTEVFFISILLFVTLVWISLIFKNSIGILNKIFTLFSSFLLCAYFYTPLSFSFITEENFSAEEGKLIPFTMTRLNFNEEEFIFFNSPLPYYNSPKLPKQKEIKNKIVVLGLRKKPELVLTYVKYLHSNQYQYLIFQDRNFEVLDSKEISFSYIEYPMFRVYYPSYGLKGKTLYDPKKDVSPTWEKEFIESKYRNLSSLEEIASILDNLTQYSGYELAQKAKTHKLPFFESCKKYAEYFYNIGNYIDAIKAGNLALLFQDNDMQTLEIIYQSLLYSIPENSHIPIMQKLSNYPNFKEMMLKRLYPLYSAMGKENEALNCIDSLISFYSSNSELNEENIQTLLANKVKILLKINKYYEAEEIIKKSLAKKPNSHQWQKIALDLKYLKENTRNYYYYYNKNIKKQEEITEQ